MAAEAVAAVEAETAAHRADGRPWSVGRVTFEPDPEIQAIIDSWPPSMRSDRARALGFGGDSSVAAIVRQHVEDEIDL